MISSYGGGGYVLDLTPNHDDAGAQLSDLEKNLWIDRGTRVVFLDFTVYNANINLFCQIKLTVEFPASGGAIPSKSFSTVKLIRVRLVILEKVNKSKEILLVCFINGLFRFGMRNFIHSFYGLL